MKISIYEKKIALNKQFKMPYFSPWIVYAAFTTLQTPSLYRLQGSPCVVILPCKDPVKITGYHSNPSSYVVGT